MKHELNVTTYTKEDVENVLKYNTTDNTDIERAMKYNFLKKRIDEHFGFPNSKLFTIVEWFVTLSALSVMGWTLLYTIWIWSKP